MFTGRNYKYACPAVKQSISGDVLTSIAGEIGNGKVPIDLTSGGISLPHNFYKTVTSKVESVEDIFYNIQDNYNNLDWLSERAILAAENNDVYELNNIIKSNIQSKAVTYKSVDVIVEADEAVNHQTEFLNSQGSARDATIHVLQLEIDVPIIRLRNINQPKLCNDTRLAVKELLSKVVEATILTGPFKGKDVLIPTDMPIPNSIGVCNCFSHGQLYVARSRVSKTDNSYICTDNDTTIKNELNQQALGN